MKTVIIDLNDKASYLFPGTGHGMGHGSCYGTGGSPTLGGVSDCLGLGCSRGYGMWPGIEMSTVGRF